VITGKLALDHGPVEVPTSRVVCQDHDAVTRRRATNDEVVRTIAEPPLPAMNEWTDFDAPASAPGEFVIDAPEWLPARIIEPENVGQEAAVVGSGGHEGPVAVKAWFGVGDAALIHAERSEHPVASEDGNRRTRTSLEVLFEQDEAFARVAPTLTRWTQWLKRLSIRAPVRKPRGVSQYVAYRDVAHDRFVEILNKFQRQVRDDLLHEGRRVHRCTIAIDLNELPIAHNCDRPAHTSSRYAHNRPGTGGRGQCVRGAIPSLFRRCRRGQERNTANDD
jgi:hypothetical protein